MCYMPFRLACSPKLASRADSNEIIFATDTQPDKSTLVMGWGAVFSKISHCPKCGSIAIAMNA